MAYEIKGDAKIARLLYLGSVTTVERTTIGGTLAAADEGATVYDNEQDIIYVWDGTQWIVPAKHVLLDWQATTDYSINEVVTYVSPTTGQQTLYRATAAMTSGATFDATEEANWTVISNKNKHSRSATPPTGADANYGDTWIDDDTDIVYMYVDASNTADGVGAWVDISTPGGTLHKSDTEYYASKKDGTAQTGCTTGTILNNFTADTTTNSTNISYAANTWTFAAGTGVYKLSAHLSFHGFSVGGGWMRYQFTDNTGGDLLFSQNAIAIENTSNTQNNSQTRALSVIDTSAGAVTVQLRVTSATGTASCGAGGTGFDQESFVYFESLSNEFVATEAEVIDDDTMASATATNVPSAESVVAYTNDVPYWYKNTAITTPNLGTVTYGCTGTTPSATITYADTNALTVIALDGAQAFEGMTSDASGRVITPEDGHYRITFDGTINFSSGGAKWVLFAIRNVTTGALIGFSSLVTEDGNRRRGSVEAIVPLNAGDLIQVRVGNIITTGTINLFEHSFTMQQIKK